MSLSHISGHEIRLFFHVTSHECTAFDLITNLELESKNDRNIRARNIKE